MKHFAITSLKMNENIIVIPAKGTSRRLPRKNMLTLGGEPLVKIAVDRAVSSKLGKVVVSTENENMIQYLKAMINDNTIHYDNVDIHRRSIRLTQDNTRAWEVCLKVADHYKDAKTIIMTLPTSPFSVSSDLISAYQMYLAHDRKAPVMSVTKVDFNPETLCCKTNKDDYRYKDRLFPYSGICGYWSCGINVSIDSVFLKWCCMDL